MYRLLMLAADRTVVVVPLFEWVCQVWNYTGSCCYKAQHILIKRVMVKCSLAVPHSISCWPGFKCPYRQFFLSDSIYHAMNLYEKKSIWIKRNLLEVHFGPPFAPVFPWLGMNCDVD